MKFVLIALFALSLGLGLDAWSSPVTVHSSYSLDVREAIRGFFSLNDNSTTSFLSTDGVCRFTLTDNTQGQVVLAKLETPDVDYEYSFAYITERGETAPMYNDHDDTYDTFITDFDWSEQSLWISYGITQVPRGADRDRQPQLTSQSKMEIARTADGKHTVTFTDMNRPSGCIF